MRSFKVKLTAGVLCVVALGIALAEDGLHPNTTRRLQTTFEQLRANGADRDNPTGPEHKDLPASQGSQDGLQRATFGTGCFWCTEAVFEELRGVKRVVSGYSGGRVRNPTYQQVLTGATGHAEAVHIEYDPQLIPYAKLLEVFWSTHDPTTRNRQGVDVGTQYRSAIFFHSDEQRELAERYKSELDKSNAFRNPLVTEITKFTAFYPAENYHQDYFAMNGRNPYCRSIIRPKLRKFRRVFRDELKQKR